MATTTNQDPETEWMDYMMKNVPESDRFRFSVNIPFDVDGNEVMTWMFDSKTRKCICHSSVPYASSVDVSIVESTRKTVDLLKEFVEKEYKSSPKKPDEQVA